MTNIRVLNPVSELRGPAQTSDPALRPNNLDGLNIGLVWNRKRGGDAVLNRVGSKLKEMDSRPTTILDSVMSCKYTYHLRLTLSLYKSSNTRLQFR